MKEAFQKVISSDSYKKYKEDHPDSFLTNVFSMVQSAESDKEWQFGFYEPKDDMLTPFVVHTEGTVEPGKADKIFREPDSKVEVLELSDDLISIEDAVNKATEVGKERFPGIVPVKYICILQNKDNAMWNITLIGSNISTANIRIDAKSGDVLHAAKVSLFEGLK